MLTLPIEILSVIWIFIDPFTWLIMRNVCTSFAKMSRQIVSSCKINDSQIDTLTVNGYIHAKYITDTALLTWALFNSSRLIVNLPLMLKIAEFGNEIHLKKVIPHTCNVFRKDILYMAAMNGNYNFLKCMCSYGIWHHLEENDHAMRLAVDGNHHNCFKYIFNSIGMASEQTRDKIIELDHVEFLITLANSHKSTICCSDIERAIKHKSHKCLKYLLMLRSDYFLGKPFPEYHKSLYEEYVNTNMCVVAVINNDIESLKLFVEFNYELTLESVIYAVSRGYLICLKFLTLHCKYITQTIYELLIDVATNANHPECVEYLLTYQNE